jgi:peptidoglycan-N-acetylglucosamine deacetylase
MGASNPMNKRKVISPAQGMGIILLSAAAFIFFLNPLIAASVALFYIILCLTASFYPATNFLGPVISRGNTGKKLVALTFDDGPSVPLTKQILDLLDKHSMKATFFVSGVNASHHPDIVREIIDRGHSIGNHSLNHNPFLMLKSYRTIYHEVSAAQEILQKIGVNTLAFRPPVGIVNPKLFPILEELGMYCVTFSCRPGDAGNRFVKHLSRKILNKVKADDIILLHDVLPSDTSDREILLTEIDTLLSGLKLQGLDVVPLTVLINKDVVIGEKVKI